MENTTSLNDILSDAPPPEAPPVETPTEAAEPPVYGPEAYQSRKKQQQEREYTARGLERDKETGQWKKKEVAVEPPADAKSADAKPAEAKPAEAKAETPPAQPDMTPREKAAFAAAADERRKRQELEAKLKAMEKPPEPPKPFWDDPEAALKASEERAQQMVMNTRLQMAETITRSQHPDFDEKLAIFQGYLQENPGVATALAQQMLAAPNPAKFVYDFGKTQIELREAGDLPSLRAKIEAETAAKVRAEVEAEYKAKAEKDAATRAAIPRSLADARNTGGQNGVVWSGPTPLEDILKP